VGTFLNALLGMPYQCQLAHGWTSLTLKISVVAVIIFIPAIFWVVPRYGAVGAAWMWVALEAGYVLIAIPLMHLRLIPDEKWRWYFADVLLPVSGAIGVVLLAQQLQPASYQDRSHWLAFLLITGGLALVASIALADRIRPRLLSIMGRSLHRQYS
jgi:O-antigen/teichoic acid export membrane protein